MSADLVDRLRSIATAYPTDIFPELTGDESDALHLLMPGIIDRISAAMGRHFSQVFLEAANALELPDANTLERLEAEMIALERQSMRDAQAFEIALAALKRVLPQTTGVLVVQDIEYSIKKIEAALREREQAARRRNFGGEQ